MLFKRSISIKLTIYPRTNYSKLGIFDHMVENDQTYPKAFSSTNGPGIERSSVLESLRLTLQNKILILSTRRG